LNSGRCAISTCCSEFDGLLGELSRLDVGTSILEHPSGVLGMMGGCDVQFSLVRAPRQSGKADH